MATKKKATRESSASTREGEGKTKKTVTKGNPEWKKKTAKKAAVKVSPVADASNGKGKTKKLKRKQQKKRPRKKKKLKLKEFTCPWIFLKKNGCHREL